MPVLITERRRRFRGVAVFVVSLLLVAVGRSGEDLRLAEANVVHVNGEPVRRQEIRRLAGRFARPILKRYGRISPEQETECIDRAIQQLVASRLIHQAARREGVGISDSEVEDRLDESDSEDTPEVRRMIRDEILFDRLMMKAKTPISQPSPREIRDFYEEHKDTLFSRERMVKARLITIAKALPETRAAELRKARRIREEAVAAVGREDASFADVAAEHCGSAVQRKNGGLIKLPTTEDQDYLFPPGHPKLLEHGVLPEGVLDALQTLDEQVVSEVIESEDGFHVVWIERLIPETHKSFAEAQGSIFRHLRERRRTRLQRTWLVRQIRDSRITYNDGSPLEAKRIMPDLPEYGER